MLRQRPCARDGVLLLVLAGTACAGAAEEAELPVFSADALLRHARHLASEELEGRKAGTAGERLVAEYIASKLDEAGIGPPPGSGRFQRFPLPVAGEPLESRNVLGWIEGGDASPGETAIVLGGHMDHLGRRGDKLHPGADDNASGVAVILEVAARLQAERGRLGRSVLIAFFGARGHAIFFFASYMNDVAEVPIRFRGVEGPGGEETWIEAGAPEGHPDWNRGGTYRHVDATPIGVDEDHDAKLNSWSYDWPRFTRPFYYGRTARLVVPGRPG